MKRHTQTLGVRKWSGNDLLELQNEGLSLLDDFFAQYGNSIISGCEVVENIISEGLVSIEGMVMPFSGATNVHSFPVYLKKSELHQEREYADGVVRDIAVSYYAEMVVPEPIVSYIKITSKGGVKFFDKANSGWLKDINSSIDTLRAKDIIILNILQQLDIPLLASTPTSETLTYDKEGKTYSFWIGQQCRVYDSEAKKYTFYQLYNVVEGVADWQTLGKGDGTGMFEVPTLPNIPDKQTLTYIKNDDEIAFLIGQQCRFYDTEKEKYVFCQLYDIDNLGVANWQIVESDGSTVEEDISIVLESNQGIGDSSLIGKVVTVRWVGQELPLELVWNGSILKTSIPMSIQYEVSVEPIIGYTSPSSHGYLAVGGKKRQISFIYSCEKAVVSVVSDDSTSTSDRTIIIKHATTGVILGSGIGSLVIIKIPMDTPYIVSVNEWDGFIKPSDQIYTAYSLLRNVSFTYKRNVDASIIFDKSISDSSNISGEINSGVLANILSKFRRCLCKKTANGQVAIAYLMDSDSTKYEDGTTAILTGAQGDVMVEFPEFYYKREDLDANRFRYRFAMYNVDGTFKHVPRSLVGAYKSYLADSKLYSISGVTPTANTSLVAYLTAATARGEGYQLIDFQQHCVIAIMLYAKYGNRDIQAVLGDGSRGSTATGCTNYLGVADTAREGVYIEDVNGLGLEGVFGGIKEFVQGVTITNRVWTINSPDGSIRNVTAGSSNGWITSVAAESSDFFDMVPINVGGSTTTYYSDYYIQMDSSVTRYLMRSGTSSSGQNGVVSSFSTAKDTEVVYDYGSRLAFRGKITKASSISSFIALTGQ